MKIPQSLKTTKRQHGMLIMPALAICGIFALAQDAQAATIGVVDYNDTITAVFGTGNPDGSWTSATNGNLNVALRGKERGTANMQNDGAGTYYFAIGTNVNLEFSIGVTDGAPLSDYQAVWSIDTDPGVGTTWFDFNPLTTYADNSWGDWGITANSGGAEGTASVYASTSSVVQNSQRTIWLPIGAAIADATHNLALAIYALSDTGRTNPLALTEATLRIGNGAAVPEPGSAMLALIGLGGLTFRRKRAA